MTWTDQVAVVTGGARGIGRAIALALAERGAAVCVNYASRPDAAEAVASEITAAKGRAITVRADVADFHAVESMMRRVEAELGPVSILVNNAGVMHSGTIETFDHDKFEAMRRVNADGVIHTTRAVAGGMRRRRYGRIVNMASIAGIGTALPGNAFYAATKAEVAILTKRFAMELGSDSITVNAVAPGFVETDMTRGTRSAQEWGSIEKDLAGRTMLRRIGRPSDIANAVAFLASPETGWMTAQILVVDGGRLDYVGHA
jgi:NAD(P)-dependent dehydrogenase (short-subunit alcohol dehydrogenase family)